MGKLIDYRYVQSRTTNNFQIRSETAKFFFVMAIVIDLKINKAQKLELKSEISVLPILPQAQYKKDPVC